MKRILDGKRYDTETATTVSGGGSSPGTSMTDFGYWEASLYRTPRGRWFLEGTGGAMSMFSQPSGNMTSGGSGIIPISKRAAREFLEREGDTEALEQWFAIEEA